MLHSSKLWKECRGAEQTTVVVASVSVLWFVSTTKSSFRVIPDQSKDFHMASPRLFLWHSFSRQFSFLLLPFGHNQSMLTGIDFLDPIPRQF